MFTKNSRIFEKLPSYKNIVIFTRIWCAFGRDNDRHHWTVGHPSACFCPTQTICGSSLEPAF